jgi:hypothetical protein
LVARAASRHHLVSLRFDGEPAPPGGELRAEGGAVGEITSSGRSTLGALGLGFVRRPWDAVGSALDCAGGTVHVVAPPLARSA